MFNNHTFLLIFSDIFIIHIHIIDYYRYYDQMLLILIINNHIFVIYIIIIDIMINCY